jgi:hypothetical protein
MAETKAKRSPEQGVRAVLLLLAAGFVAFGVAFLLSPAKLAAYVDLEAKGRAALVELRAFYGGLETGFGVFLAVAALRRAWQVPALVAALLSLVGVVAARIYGLSVEGSAGALIYVFLAIEIAGVIAATWGLSQARRAEKAGPSDKDMESALAELDAAPPLKKSAIDKTRPIERTKRIDKTEKIRTD